MLSFNYSIPSADKRKTQDGCCIWELTVQYTYSTQQSLRNTLEGQPASQPKRENVLSTFFFWYISQLLRISCWEQEMTCCRVATASSICSFFFPSSSFFTAAGLIKFTAWMTALPLSTWQRHTAVDTLSVSIVKKDRILFPLLPLDSICFAFQFLLLLFLSL